MRTQDLFLVAGLSDQSLQTLVNRCASSGIWGVIIPANYTGTDSFTNPGNVAVIDLRTNGTGLGGVLANGGGGTSNVQTQQVPYILTSDAVSGNIVNIPVTWVSPYADTSYSVEVTVECMTSTLPTWSADTEYDDGFFILDSNGNIQDSGGGTSGSPDPPAWNEQDEGNTSDGTITWTTLGLYDLISFVGIKQKTNLGCVIEVQFLGASIVGQNLPFLFNVMAVHN